jgi:hypothetical protein
MILYNALYVYSCTRTQLPYVYVSGIRDTRVGIKVA